MQVLLRDLHVATFVLGLAVLCCHPAAAPHTAAARQAEAAGHVRRLLSDQPPLDDEKAQSGSSYDLLVDSGGAAAAGTCGSGYKAAGKLCGEQNSYGAEHQNNRYKHPRFSWYRQYSYCSALVMQVIKHVAQYSIYSQVQHLVKQLLQQRTAATALASERQLQTRKLLLLLNACALPLLHCCPCCCTAAAACAAGYGSFVPTWTNESYPVLPPTCQVQRHCCCWQLAFTGEVLRIAFSTRKSPANFVLSSRVVDMVVAGMLQ
jgi:hypothetical protein